MKKLTLIFVIAFSITAHAQWQGSGTKLDPYLIYTCADLELLAENVKTNPVGWSVNKYFILMNDITDSVRTMIGEPNREFSGKFDGQNFTITLAIENNAYVTTMGLFFLRSPLTQDTAVIKNITVDGWVKGQYAGGIAGTTYTVPTDLGTILISNCINAAKISSWTGAGSSVVGGIIGYQFTATVINTTLVENCINIGDIFGMHSGGIVGVSNCIIITNCINYGYVTGTTYAGGILGYGYSLLMAIIQNCVNIGIVDTTPSTLRSGCIVGNKNNEISVQNCWWDKQMCPAEDD